MLTVAARAVVSGLLGSFRGGEVLKTGHTQITRILWALATATLLFVSNPVWLPMCMLALALYLMMLIPHAQYQNSGVDNYAGMGMIGAMRGIILAAFMGYFYGHNLILMPIGMAAVQGLSYAIGWQLDNIKVFNWLRGGTQWAEFIWGVLLYVMLWGFLYV